VKQGALVGLRELLTLHPSELDQHLSSLLSEAAAVFTDKDPNVRMSATRLLRLENYFVMTVGICLQVFKNIYISPFI
jgi:glutathione synthase/RimK-type ligase-like ATP-grasp enzyme